MGSSGPKLQGEGSGIPASAFVEDGKILVGKLIGVTLGSLWLAVVGGWITVFNAIVQINVEILNAFARMYVRVLTAVGVESSETLEVAWAAAFRSAVEASPFLAPVIFTLEVVAVAGILLAARRWIT